MPKLRVLVTGATGYIADQLLPTFREHYDLRMIDIRPETSAGQPVAGVAMVDLPAADTATPLTGQHSFGRCNSRDVGETRISPV